MNDVSENEPTLDETIDCDADHEPSSSEVSMLNPAAVWQISTNWPLHDAMATAEVPLGAGTLLASDHPSKENVRANTPLASPETTHNKSSRLAAARKSAPRIGASRGLLQRKCSSQRKRSQFA